MERPPSQTENFRPSGIRPPSKVPTLANVPMTRALGETSQSSINARNGMADNGVTGPPSGIPSKHKPPGLPEPPAKRKTLVERAGEPLNPPRSYLPNVARLRNGYSHARTKSQPSKGTHCLSNTSAGSTIATVGARPPSRQQTTVAVQERERYPAVGSTDDPELDSSEMIRNRKGTAKPAPLNSPGITLRKTRKYRNLSGACQSVMQPGKVYPVELQHANRCEKIHCCSDDSRKSSDSEPCNTSSRSSSIQSTASSTIAEVCEPTRAEATYAPIEIGKARKVSMQQVKAHQVSPSSTFSRLNLSSSKLRKPSSSSLQRPRHHPSLERIKEEASPSKLPKYSCTPSLRHTASTQSLQCTPSNTPLPQTSNVQRGGLRTPVTNRLHNGRFNDEIPIFLTKEKLTSFPAWDTTGRLEDMETMYVSLRNQVLAATQTKDNMEAALAVYKSQIDDLKETNRELSGENKNIASDLERARNDLHTTTIDLRQARRDHERDMLDMERKVERDVSDLQCQHEKEIYKLERERDLAADSHEKKVESLSKEWEQRQAAEMDRLMRRQIDDMDQMQGDHKSTIAALQMELDVIKKSDESRATESATQVQGLRDSINSLQYQLDVSNSTNVNLRSQVSAAESRNAALEQEKTALISKAHFLEGNQEAQSLEFTSMSTQLRQAVEARNATLEMLRKEETVRRKLSATILELKGNIRVFVRTRPLLSDEHDPSKADYPDAGVLDGGKELVIHAPTTFSAIGKERNEKHSYAFDRVFAPSADNSTVFQECRDLIQSVVDGYNVSVLSYGQTGSGKTFGMSGVNGVIPSSIDLMLSELRRLKGKGWEYTVEASFVEVYNETLNDLLGDAKTWDEGDGDMNASVRGKSKEKHEIHHDLVTGKTTVTNLTNVQLWPPSDPAEMRAATDDTTGTDDEEISAARAWMQKTVDNLLDTAARNRRVAATKANERSSRSHSIFMLSLKGSCAATNESSEGILNLVDLAGSERLKQSGAEGSRMKETQAINKSLSSLGDVIAALSAKGGVNEAHVPYRNSKLTYLLQSSLGGKAANGKSSRTLMLLHLSPLAAHWQESRSSLLFGTKVHGTHIGTAKKR